MRILGERVMLSEEPQSETSRQRRSTLTPRQRLLAPKEPALISSRRRRRPVSAYSIPHQVIPIPIPEIPEIPARLPNITNKEQFIETKDMLIGILNNMMKKGNETRYNYETGVPHIIKLLEALRMRLRYLNLGRDAVDLEWQISEAILDTRFWIRDYNEQNMPE
jgi:hypothetical protein